MKHRSLLTVLSVVVILSFISSASAATPYIFHITQSAKANQIIGIQGDQFGSAPEVWIDRIVDSNDTPDPELQLEILNQSDDNIAAKIPANMDMGLYAIFVKNTDGAVSVSAPAYVNQAYVYNVLDLASKEIDSGRTFRLTGLNLDFTDATSQVWFRKVSDSTMVAATVNDTNDPNILEVTSPSLVTGESYVLVVSNGFGGSYGQVDSWTLTATATGTDHWALDVPWAAKFTFYNNVYNVKTDARLSVKAVGDGTTDDAAAIQEAIYDASNDGGGVVYLPTGDYNLNGQSLGMRSNVVIEGDGMDNSLIFSNSGTAPMLAGPNDMVNFGFVDIAFESQANGPDNMSKFWWGNYLFALRTRFTQHNWHNVIWKFCRKVLIKDCELYQLPETGKYIFMSEGCQDMKIVGTYFEWHDGRIYTPSMARVQIEDCSFIRSVYTDGGGECEYGALALEYSDNLTILNNHFGKSGTGPIPQANDGETILNQFTEGAAVGIVSSATSTTLSDSSQSWSSNSLKNLHAMIISGPGKGQRRKVLSNTSTTMTLDSAWEVTPTTESRFAVHSIDSRYMILGNELNDCPRGIWFYCSKVSDLAIINNQLTNSEGIYIRADQRMYQDPQRFDVYENIVIKGNIIRNTLGLYPAKVDLTALKTNDGEDLYGESFYGATLRNNKIDATVNNYSWSSEAFTAVYISENQTTDDDSQMMSGVIFDSNELVDTNFGVNVSTGANQAVIWNTKTTNLQQQLVRDRVRSGANYGSEQTYVLTDITIDNGDPTGVTITGTWPSSTHYPGFYDTEYIYDDNENKGNKSVRFTPDLPSTGVYFVYGRWTSSSSRNTNVPFDIIHSEGTDTIFVDQTQNGSQWTLLGAYSFDKGTNGSVLIRTDGTTEYVIADAIRFVKPSQCVMDNNDTSHVTLLGSWTTSTSNPYYYADNYIHDGNTSKGSKSVVFTPDIQLTGTYGVYAWWTEGTNRASNVPIDIHHATGTATVTINETTNGGHWVYLGSYPFDLGNSETIVVRTDSTNGYVIVDAIAVLQE